MQPVKNTILALLALALGFASQARAQGGLNVDFGTAFGVPFAGYGAASGQSGNWNQAGLGATALVGLTGTVSGVSLNLVADSPNGAIIPPANDAELLLHDNFFSFPAVTWSVSFSGLANRNYDVFLYAPSNTTVSSGAMTVGGIPVADLPGSSSSALVQGTSWAKVQVSVTGGSLDVSGAGTGFSGLAGLQLVPRPMLPPPDLDPGDPYRVVFVTDSWRDATSVDIADYNAFVNADANAVPELQALGTTFAAVASTPTVHATANTQTDPSPAGSTGVPVYRVDGVRVADDYDQLWNTTGWLQAPIAVTASGLNVNTAGHGAQIWTGTRWNFASGNELGDPDLTSMVGTLNLTSSAWHESFPIPNAGHLRFYGMSGVLTAPSPLATYCTAGTSASGCRATLSASGVASASAASGFNLSASNVEGAKDGLFFYGSNGRQANSWGNGTSYQCVVPPVKRAGLLSAAVGSTVGSCDGSFSQDLTALWASNSYKNPGEGSVVQAQLWYRDPLNTSNQTTSLSNAVEFTVAP